MFDFINDTFRIVAGRVCTLPGDIGNKAVTAENLITNQLEIGILRIINADENNTIVRQQLLQQLQARVHHAQPLVMAGQILALFADDLAQPLFDLRGIDIIIVDPSLVAGVVGRIDVDALDTPLLPGQQCFQGFQIIAPDDHVFAAVVRVCLSVFIKAVLALQHPKRHVLMVIEHLAFSNPFKCWHG